MATDKSEPKTILIFKVLGGAIVTLVLIRVGMVSYFDNVAADIRAQQALETQKPEMSSVNAASSALVQGPMPIDKAMQMMANASPNRQGMTGVEPQVSHDMRAVTDCWAQMGCDGGGLDLAALAVDAAAPAAQTADAAPAGDAGPAAAADAGKGAAPAPRNNPPRPNPAPQNPRLPRRTNQVKVSKHHALLRALSVLAMLAAVALVPSRAGAEPMRAPTGGISDRVPPELQGIDVHENLGGQLPLAARFKDADGNDVTLGKYFDHKRPVLLVFAYHSCPMLCSLVLDGVVNVLKEIDWTVGKEFDVVSISFDPHDTPQTAAAKRAQLVEKYGRGGNAGWDFLVGDDHNIQQVTGTVGFQYRWDERQKMFAHPAAIYLLTPDGKIARYLYAISFDADDIKYGLLEASEGRSITTTEKFLIWCYHYDPQSGRYTLAAMTVMRIGGALTVAAIGTVLFLLWRREKKKNRTSRTADANAAAPATPTPLTQEAR